MATDQQPVIIRLVVTPVRRLGGPIMTRTDPAKWAIFAGQKWPASNEKACVAVYKQDGIDSTTILNYSEQDLFLNKLNVFKK